MGYKTIRLAGFTSGLLGGMFVVLRGLQIFGLLGSDGQFGSYWALGWVGFSTLSTVALAAVKILEAQADQIADLQRQLAELSRA